jgi:hypothetical protein
VFPAFLVSGPVSRRSRVAVAELLPLPGRTAMTRPNSAAPRANQIGSYLRQRVARLFEIAAQIKSRSPARVIGSVENQREREKEKESRDLGAMFCCVALSWQQGAGYI